jgi:ADP-heptose:LPS heptosyltransferase
MKTAMALWLAGIDQRFGPATKLAQLFLNKRLRQKRSLSQKPEYEYNLDLIRHYITSNGDNPVSLQAPPFLAFNTDEIRDLKNKFKQQHKIADAVKIIIIHPGTGGSAINLSPEQYAAIAQNIAKNTDVFFIITAGPGETEIAEKLSGLLTDTPHCTYYSTDGIVNFSKFITICDLFISGSTGPLHIAGALNVPTAAFYPAKRSATPLRWQTLNQQDRRLAISPLQHNDEYDMRTINTETSSDLILQLLGRMGK